MAVMDQVEARKTYDSNDMRAYFQITDKTLSKWIREGLIPRPMVASRRAWRWDAAAFDEWARSQTLPR